MREELDPDFPGQQYGWPKLIDFGVCVNDPTFNRDDYFPLTAETVKTLYTKMKNTQYNRPMKASIKSRGIVSMFIQAVMGDQCRDWDKDNPIVLRDATLLLLKSYNPIINQPLYDKEQYENEREQGYFVNDADLVTMRATIIKPVFVSRVLPSSSSSVPVEVPVQGPVPIEVPVPDPPVPVEVQVVPVDPMQNPGSRSRLRELPRDSSRRRSRSQVMSRARARPMVPDPVPVQVVPVQVVPIQNPESRSHMRSNVLSRPRELPRDSSRRSRSRVMSRVRSRPNSSSIDPMSNVAPFLQSRRRTRAQLMANARSTQV
jgi:hypothetical protein